MQRRRWTGARGRRDRSPKSQIARRAASGRPHTGTPPRKCATPPRKLEISHRPLSAVTQRPSGLPSFRLGLLLANAKDYDGYSIDKALRRDDEHARILFQQAADIGHVGAQVSLGEFHQAGRGRKRGGVPPMIAGVTSRQNEKDTTAKLAKPLRIPGSCRNLESQLSVAAF